MISLTCSHNRALLMGSYKLRKSNELALQVLIYLYSHSNINIRDSLTQPPPIPFTLNNLTQSSEIGLMCRLHLIHHKRGHLPSIGDYCEMHSVFFSALLPIIIQSSVHLSDLSPVTSLSVGDYKHLAGHLLSSCYDKLSS